ncbi:MAG: OmpA family protein [Desulfocapsaceae bacterium]|nr:OmpA family protein [Desulfocapsaceae bacterium]
MLRKIAFVTFLALFLGTYAHAIEFPKGGSPFFYRQSTAYSSVTFNKIMEAYGLNLDMNKAVAADLPSSYAIAANGKPVFNKIPMAYIPTEYHDIFTAYGLELNEQYVQNELNIPSYARIAGDNVKFGSTRVAYGAEEWENILGAYSLPMKKKPVAAKPKPKPAPKPVIGDSDGDGVMDNVDVCPDTPRGAKVDERGCWALPNNVLFDFNQAELKEGYASNLDTVKNVFDDNPNLKVRVEGHTDSRGTEAYNQGLSERRAKVVYDYLIEELAISPERLRFVGYGESRPAYTNDTDIGRAFNRRVELTPFD